MVAVNVGFRLGLAKEASQGEWTGRVAPYGYGYDIDRKMLVPNDDEAANVRRIFDPYVRQQVGSRSVSDWMNDHGFLTRRNARWTPKKIIDVLRSPTHSGRLPSNRDVYDAERGGVIGDPLAEGSRRRSEDGEHLRGDERRLKRCGTRSFSIISRHKSTLSLQL